MVANLRIASQILWLNTCGPSNETATVLATVMQGDFSKGFLRAPQLAKASLGLIRQ